MQEFVGGSFWHLLTFGVCQGGGAVLWWHVSIHQEERPRLCLKLHDQPSLPTEDGAASSTL